MSNWYILETSYEDERHDPNLMDERQLRLWFTAEIEHRHYSGSEGGAGG